MDDLHLKPLEGNKSLTFWTKWFITSEHFDKNEVHTWWWLKLKLKNSVFIYDLNQRWFSPPNCVYYSKQKKNSFSFSFCWEESSQ